MLSILLQVLLVKVIDQTGVDDTIDVLKLEDGSTELLLIVTFHGNYHAPVRSSRMDLDAFQCSECISDGRKIIGTCV